MAGTTGPLGTDNFDRGGAAPDIGWLRAHVRVGQTYPLVAVRVYRRAVQGGGIVHALDSEDEAVRGALSYAIAFAHQVDQLDLRVSQLETDVSLVGAEDNVSVELRLWLDSPLTADVNENLLRETARRELADAIAAGKWELGPAAVHVLLMQVGAARAAEVADSSRAVVAASAPAATTSPPAEDTDEPRQPRVTARLDWPRVGLALLVLLAVGLVGRGAMIWSDLSQGGERLPDGANPVATAALPAEEVPTAAPPTATAVSAQRVATSVAAAPVPAQAPPTPSPAPEIATARATVVPATAEPVLLDFAPNRSSGLAWPNDQNGVGWFAPDGYHLAARNPGNFVAIGVLATQEGSSAVVSATFHKLSGPGGGGYGLIVGDQGPGPRDGINQGGSYMVFEVGDRGEVGAWRRAEDHWVDILGWTPSEAVKQDSADNTLELRVTPSGVAFTVNGTDIPVSPAEQPGAGGIGVFLGGDGNQAVVTRLTVTRLD